MTHQLAKGSDIIGAIITALHNTTLNGGTVTVVAQPGGHAAQVQINGDSTGAYLKTWELQLR